jgi:hypothetical protein
VLVDKEEDEESSSSSSSSSSRAAALARASEDLLVLPSSAAPPVFVVTSPSFCQLVNLSVHPSSAEVLGCFMDRLLLCVDVPPPVVLIGLGIAVSHCMLVVCPVMSLNNYRQGVEGITS